MLAMPVCVCGLKCLLFHFDCVRCSTAVSVCPVMEGPVCVSQSLVSSELQSQQTAARLDLMTNVFTEEKLMIFLAGVNGYVNTQK